MHGMDVIRLAALLPALEGSAEGVWASGGRACTMCVHIPVRAYGRRRPASKVLHL